MKSVAYKLGKEAFVNDTATAACQDKRLMEMIKSGGNTIALLNDWNRGYHIANLQSDIAEKEENVTPYGDIK